MNLLAALFLLFIVPLLIFAVARGSAGRSGTAVLIGLTLAGATLIAAGLDLSRPAVGVVAGKTEYFEFSETGVEPRVTRRLIFTVTGRDLGTMRFNVEARVYDAFRVGQPIALHCLYLGPLRYGRPDAEPWWNLMPGRLESWPPSGEKQAEVLGTRATILSARTVRDADVYTWASFFGQSRDFAHISLPQPYDEIQFRFSTTAGADIVGLDRVDSGSAGPLARGDLASVIYPQTEPHRARLLIGTREHRARNSENYWGGQALVAGIIVAFIGLIAAGRRLARRRIPPVSKTRTQRRP